MPRRRGLFVGLLLAVALAMGLVGPAASAHPRPPIDSERGPASPLTSPTLIRKLAAAATIWGLPAEFVYRFENYNDLVTAPRNELGGGGLASAWNNNGTNAGDASVLYLNAMMDLSGQRGRGGTKELVLTVPPSRDDYYVVNLLDAFINTVGSIGTRTTPSTKPQTYLLAGPTSQYAHKRTVTIKGFSYRVMTTDTNLNWMLIRIRADTLVPASDPASAASVKANVVERFAMSTLKEFQRRGHRPDYVKPGSYTPTDEDRERAAKWQNAPTQAPVFFAQLGRAVQKSPLPTARTGLNGTPLRLLPAWVVPQSGANRVYLNPSFGQRRTLASFRPLGLTADGWRMPRNWGPAQRAALQHGFDDGMQRINEELAAVSVTAETNFWSYLNNGIGNYANTPEGYLYRATIVLAGGSANMPQDAIYAQLNNLDGTQATEIDGNNSYTLTFRPPVTDPDELPVVGTLPPMVDDAAGDPRGFWSIHAYAVDDSESSAPFITQASVLNTAYSHADLEVTAVDAAADTVTVKPSSGSTLVASSPVLFGEKAAEYGLTPGVPYYVVADPVTQRTRRGDSTATFQVTSVWQQDLSPNNVPIQQVGGTPGPTVDLTNPGGSVDLTCGPVQPVSQLGSQQLTSGQLAKNPDGSITIWIAPKLPQGAPATNWLPTPSDDYYAPIYPGKQIPTRIRPMIRMYYPTPGSDSQASILPPPTLDLSATYVLPELVKLG